MHSRWGANTDDKNMAFVDSLDVIPCSQIYFSFEVETVVFYDSGETEIYDTLFLRWSHLQLLWMLSAVTPSLQSRGKSSDCRGRTAPKSLSEAERMSNFTSTPNVSTPVEVRFHKREKRSVQIACIPGWLRLRSDCNASQTTSAGDLAAPLAFSS